MNETTLLARLRRLLFKLTTIQEELEYGHTARVGEDVAEVAEELEEILDELEEAT